MDGICTNCGLAYSPDDRECRQCGQELGGEERRGFLGRLFRSRRPAARPDPAAAGPEVAATATHHTTTTTSGSTVSVSVDGDAQVYTSLDQVPAEFREKIRDALEMVEDLLPDDDPDR